MTEEQKMQFMMALAQSGANIHQINLGDGTQNFYLNKDGSVTAKEEEAEVEDAEVIGEDSCFAQSNIIFNTRILTTEALYKKVHVILLSFIKQDGVTSDTEQITPSAQNEWYYIMKGIRESGVANGSMGDTKFAEQMVVWFPDLFAEKIGEGDSKDFVRNFAKSISAERNYYWTQGAERKEIAIIDMHAHARTRRIDNGKVKRAFLIANGLKKALEELKTEIQKAQNQRNS